MNRQAIALMVIFSLAIVALAVAASDSIQKAQSSETSNTNTPPINTEGEISQNPQPETSAFVVPEYTAFGGLLALGVCFAAFAVSKSRITKHRNPL